MYYSNQLPQLFPETPSNHKETVFLITFGLQYESGH